MYKQCRTEQSAVRQRQLEQGLMEAMMKKKYEEISVTDLCVELGIPRKAFYRYFSDKDGALHRVQIPAGHADQPVQVRAAAGREAGVAVIPALVQRAGCPLAAAPHDPGHEGRGDGRQGQQRIAHAHGRGDRHGQARHKRP